MSPFDERDEREERERKVRVLISDKRHSRDLEAEEEEAAQEAAQVAAAEAEQASAPGAAAADAPAVLDFPGGAEQGAARAAVPTPLPQATPSTDDFDDDSAPWTTGQIEAEMPARGEADFPGALDGQFASGQVDESHSGAAGPAGEPPMSEEEQAAAAIEMAQLQQVFAGGLSRYLQAQLGLLLNFALIGLGRAPDPTSGLVTQNLGQARMAIDVLEFLVLRLEGDLHPQDRQQLAQLIADLKYAFMQLVQAPAPGGIVPPGGIGPPGAGA